MSRIGKKPVAVPSGVSVGQDGETVRLEGPKGSLSYTHRPEVGVKWDESERQLQCTIDDSMADDRKIRAHWGTTRAQLQNLIDGVTKGYEKKLEVVGVGWTAVVQGNQLKLTVGYANPVMVQIPDGVQVAVERQMITVTGIDKQAVGQFAAQVRGKRPPEPYNGKGIKYSDEVVRRKQGKQFGA